MDGRSVSARREDGFTLVELLIGIAIAGMLIGVIGSAMVVGLKTTDATTQRLSESHDAQVTSAYLANDVQSATSVNVSPSGTVCQGGGTRLVAFNYATTGSPWACYYWGPSGGESRVTRSFGGTTTVVAHLTGITAPTVACTPSCGATHVDSVTLSITEASGFSYDLTGSRRKFSALEGTGSGSGTTDDMVLFAFGNSPLLIRGKCTQGDVINARFGCVAGDVGFASKLIVKGNLLINKPTSGPAVELKGANGGGSGYLLSATGAFKIQQYASNLCSHCNNGNTNPFPPGSYPTPLLDPLRFMADPPAGPQRTCNSGICLPGVYSSFNPSGNVTLSPGIYILQNGMSINGNVQVNGTGVTLFNQAGVMKFNGSSAINITAPTTGQYANVLIFQARDNPADLTFGGTNSIVSLSGVVYAPFAQHVYLGSGTSDMSVTAVVAQNVVVSGNSTVTIGK